jgi:uncharacterized protein
LEQLNHKLSLPSLALQYGTITDEQHIHISKLYALKKKEGIDLEQLLLTQKFATQYQIGLLKLIQGYLVIKKQGEEFGKIAIKKGLATQKDVNKALAHQKKEFQRVRVRKLIGDILVESQVITVKQKKLILKEQTFLDKQAKTIFNSQTADLKDEQINLSKYEKQFLQIKVLDQEFAASVVEKGLASEQEAKTAQKVQEESFEKEKKIRILGDIMVELDFLTQEQKDLVLKEQQREQGAENQAVNSVFQLNISKDQMEATVTAKKDFSNITLQGIKQALETNGIKYGIYPDAILQCNLEHSNEGFIAAKQDFSLELIKDRQAIYSFTTDKIDTEIKNRGETLVEQRIGKGRYIKKDLFGNNIEQATGYDFAFRCASGTRFSKDHKKAFAGKTGFPSLSIEKKIYIHPAINVLEDADLKYGPLEDFANLKISGVLTGAYPVNAGNIDAREIRGARIDAVGDVKSRVGITDSVISTQGDVYARYIHNSRIETFGNIYIENEIIDSQIFCSGKIDSGKCRIITSTLYGKQGIELSGVGSDKTKDCVLGAGTEHHVIEKARIINLKIKEISRELNDLKEKKQSQDYYAKKTFQKMIELKIFHDRAKNKKQKLAMEFKKRQQSITKAKLKNIAVLINNFENRMSSSLSSLKKLNQTKKQYDRESKKIDKKIERLEPKITKKILDLQKDLFVFFEWARKQSNNPQIKINKKVFAGTIMKGVFSSLKIENDIHNIKVIEKQDSNNNFYMAQQE